MKFEHILQVYWTKGFFFGGRILPFDQTVTELMHSTPTLGRAFRQLTVERFELTGLEQKRSMELPEYQQLSHRVIDLPLNIIYSQVHTVNHQHDELLRFNIIRLYLIKTYRGKCHALGKPVRGQRTWSNAWNSYRCNKVLRSFIADTRRYIRENTREEKKNYKTIVRKYATTQKLNPLTRPNTKRHNRSAWY
jgi:ribosomal protein S13